MNNKKMAYGVLLITLIGISYSLFFSATNPSSQQHADSAAETRELVVPAIIDAMDDVTRIPALQNGIVNSIHVEIGQMVKKGQALFSLDDTAAKHLVTISSLEVRRAENGLVIQTKNLKHAKTQLRRLKSLDKRAVNQAELREKIHEVKMAKIQLKQAQQGLDVAKANLDNARLALSHYVAVAPKDGIVLQIKAHVDEFVGGGSQVVYLGDAKKVIVRVSIDERDIKSFAANAKAFLTSSQNSQLFIPLTFIQLDGYIITNDRLNARVQEALYFFNRNEYPGFAAGQQFDAHIYQN